MQYDFSEFFKDNNEVSINEFIDNYTTLVNSEATKTIELIDLYKSIIHTFSVPFTEDIILKLFEDLAKHELLLENPYVIISNEIYCLQTILTKQAITVNSNANIFNFFTLFDKVNNKIADIYLEKHIEKLLSVNTVRINSISDLVDRNIIKHYEAHLIWLSKLAKYIQNHDDSSIPELDETRCEFGKWLDTEAKSIIQNNSKYKTIQILHKNLHTFGSKIQNHIDNDEQHILITYLEKCELLSLSIGTELALIDNIIMNKKITKDSLTGAMNRNGLASVFHSQYELSLATGNSFVLAICDLDHFKSINDTHGHIVGDKMLKLFVDVCKKYIRNSDVIIRYGGEEFVIILPAISKEKGYETLETIRKEFENSFITVDEKKINATVSAGVVEVSPEYYYKQSFLNEYINIADQKLYMAKNSGRNRVEVC